jgi:radical SAM protein with 4Fe4S-binding SPASM domain
VKIEVTQKCPLDCLHCSSEANNSKSRQLDEKLVSDLIRDAKLLNAKEIIFSGGEPLEWEPLCRCLELCKDLGLKTCVYTTCNSFYQNEKLRKDFIKSGVDNIVVSLFGANQKEHEKVTRIYGSFEKTIQGIKSLSQTGINISVHFVAMKQNWRQLAGVVDLVENLKVKKVSVLRFVPHGRGEIVKDIQNLNREELKELKREIIRLRENPNVFIRVGSPFNILSLETDVDCEAGICRIIIGSDGIVYPCDAFKNVIPEGKFISVYEGSLKEIWEKSEYLNDIRQKLKQGLCSTCRMCVNHMKCKGGCLAQKIIRFNGKYDIPDPDCIIHRQGGVYEQLKFEV